MAGIISNEARCASRCQSAWRFLEDHGEDLKLSRVVMVFGTGQHEIKDLRLILKSGWREYFWEFWGLIVPRKRDHRNSFIIGELLDGTPIVISCGRPHLNQEMEKGETGLIRLWMGILFVLKGPGRLVILGQAVGGFGTDMKVGALALPTEYEAGDYGGCMFGVRVSTDGHKAPETLLQQPKSMAYAIICKHAQAANIEISREGQTNCFKFVAGPNYGGKGERRIYGQVWGCNSIGMSVPPELNFIIIENETNNTDGFDILVIVIQVVSDNQEIPVAGEVNKVVEGAAPRFHDTIVRAMPELLGLLTSKN